MSAIALHPEGASVSDANALAVEWPSDPARRGARCVISVDPWLTQFGVVPDAALDLARVAIAAFIADQLTPRSAIAWQREIRIIVHVRDKPGLEPVTDLLEDLLCWLSGDEWTIDLEADTTAPPREPSSMDDVERISLLSGGADSLCGAVIATGSTAFLGHWDNTAVKRAQNLTRQRLEDLRGTLDYQQIELKVIGAKDRNTRTRSLMFMALATAAAAARNASSVMVPENGFTSLNPPLSADRGGPHTTRSTHPTTFAYANAINAALGIGVTFDNPHQWQTKGELIRAATDVAGAAWMQEAIPATLSCAALNSQWYRGGNPNLNCGICIACMTRRGALRVAGVIDNTEYAIDRLTGASRDRFLRERGKDLPAVQACSGWTPEPPFIVAMGPFLAGFDYEQASRLLAAGIEELVRGLPN